MQELTLTGATLLSDNQNKEMKKKQSDAGGGAAVVSGSSVEMSSWTSGLAKTDTASTVGSSSGGGGLATTTSGAVSTTNAAAGGTAQLLQQPGGGVGVGVQLYHQQGGHHQPAKPCCPKNRCGSVMPVVQLQMPAAELVKQDAATVRKAVTMIVRMGPIHLLEEILQAWKDEFAAQQKQKQQQSNASDDNSNTTASAERQLKNQLSQLDEEGHSVLHWAAKRTDEVRMLQTLQQHCSADLVTAATADSTGMTALHWACTEPAALPVIKCLLQRGPDLLERQDSSGCTPLLIAAQYGQVESVAYLLQRGARFHAVDASRDSATHWAAYKGSSAVLGLLSFYDASPLTQPDAYGQTPLHLAALRGHTSCCRYILQQVSANQARELLHAKDKNGRTAAQLAEHKQKPTVAAVLRRHQDRLGTSAAARRQNAWKRWPAQLKSAARQVLSWHSWKVWLGLPVASDDAYDEAPQFPYSYVLGLYAANCAFYLTVFVPVLNTAAGVMWDCMFWHAFNIAVLAASACFLHKCTHTDPGRYVIHHQEQSQQQQQQQQQSKSGNTTAAADDECWSKQEMQYWRQLYEETLEAYADYEQHSDMVAARQLCHTCHIVRPPRSKHDRYSRTCVLQFDHHCPFVGTTVGLYNYKWFYMTLLTMTVYMLSFLIMLAVYVSRYRHENKDSETGHGAVPGWTLLAGVFLGAHILMSGGLFIYHTQLSLFNLTTNEHHNLHKYEYFWIVSTSSAGTGQQQQSRRFYNPWNKGYWNNVRDRVFPGPASYLLPEERVGLLRRQQQQQQQQNSRSVAAGNETSLSAVVTGSRNNSSRSDQFLHVV